MTRPVAILQDGGDRPVHRPAFTPQHRLVGRFVQQRMTELVAALRHPREDAGLDELREQRRSVRVGWQQLRQQVDVELPADRRTALKEHPDVGPELIEPGHQRGLQRHRQQRVRGDGHGRGELFREEGQPVSPLGDVVDGGSRESRNGDGSDQRADIRFRQRADAQRPDLRAGQPRLGLGRTNGAQDEELPVGHGFEDLFDQLSRRRVGPVGVLDVQYAGAGGDQLQHPLDHRPQLVGPPLLGRPALGRSRGRGGQDEGGERYMAGHRRALDRQPGHRRTQLPHELVDEAGLTDPGLPHDGEDDPRARQDLAPRRSEHRQFDLPTDEGEDTVDIGPGCRGGRPDGEDLHLGPHSLEGWTPEALHVPPLADEPPGLVTDDDGAGFGDALDPRCHVGGVSEYGRVPTTLPTEYPDHGQPRVDTHPGGEVDSVGRPEFLAQIDQAVQ